jgi:hypothetical protein
VAVAAGHAGLERDPGFHGPVGLAAGGVLDREAQLAGCTSVQPAFSIARMSALPSSVFRFQVNATKSRQ